MRRRDLLLALGGTAVLLPFGAAAQQRVPVVGCLFIANAVRSVWWLDAWRKGLAESGFVAGRNLEVDYRYAQGDLTRLPGFAADLVARRVAVIVTTTGPAVAAAKQATTTIPIVFNYIDDPVGSGLVKSFSRPGGNITGIANTNHGEMAAKRLQLLREAVPAASRVGYLVVEQEATARHREMEAVTAAGKELGVEVVPLKVGSLEEIDLAFAAAKQHRVGAVLVQSPSTLFYAEQKRVLAAAARQGMPVASDLAGFAANGGLMGYGFTVAEVPFLTGIVVARILKGEDPAELPVQRPITTRLELNLKAARALGLTIPPGLLARADEVIE